MDVRVDDADGVAVITLDRPESRNAITRELFVGLAEAVRGADPAKSRAIVLTGAGDYFCAGVDLKAMAAAAGSEEEALGEVLDAGIEAVLALHESPLPSISAVRGGAVGGGLGLALATDFCLAARDAKLATQYARVGATPDIGVSWFLTRRLGSAAATRLLLRSPKLSGEEARAIGLVDEVADDDAVLEKALALAEEISGRTPTVVRGVRALSAEAAQHTLAEQMAAEKKWVHRCWDDPAAQEYARAFQERSATPESWRATSGL